MAMGGMAAPRSGPSLRLGLLLPGDLPPAEALELGRLAENTGLRTVWVAENLYYPGAFSLAGAVVAATKRIRIGIGVVSPYARHPVILAMEAGLLHWLSNGRFLLGLGTAPAEFVGRMGIDTSLPLAVMREATEIIKRLNAGGIDRFEGKRFQVHDVKLSFPVADGGAPVYFGTTGEKMFGVAGQVGDGVIFSVMYALPLIDRAMARIRQGGEEANRDPAAFDAIAYVPCAVDSDPSRARGQLKPLLASFISRFAGKPSLERILIGSGVLDASTVQRIARGVALGESPLELVDDVVVDGFCIAGDEGDCRRRLEEYRRAGVREIAVVNIGIGAESREMLTRLAALFQLTGSANTS